MDEDRRRTMKANRLAGLTLVAALAASCSSSKSPAPDVPVEAAKKADLSALVGKWTGDYSSKDTGRSGSIVFELRSGGSTTANGDVLMWPKGSKQPMAPSKSGDLTEEQLRTMPQVLNINFVQSQGGYVTGTMDPYTDPDCQCEVRTTFVGSIDGDVIVGEFTIEHWDKQGKSAKGVWKVTRQKA
jgi:hypothetical protein